ncbi:hypothetical protein Btru_054556 [Bulinus truncatus]|nr:hypothetical protein Btru_054556 [Bulinus truncatus]
MNNNNQTSEGGSITDDIQRYYMWVLSSIGIPANVLALVVIVTMQKMTPATLLTAILAVCDSCALVTKLVNVNLTLYNVLSEAVCKMDFVAGFFSSLANWTLVLICVERFVAVCYPLKKEYLVTLRMCYVIFGFTAVILLVPRMSVFITMRCYDDNSEKLFDGPKCITKDEYTTFWANYWHWINNFVLVFIPYFIIIALTIVIILKLRLNASQRRRTLHGSWLNLSPNSNIFNAQILHDNERSERALTWMLALTAVLFLVLTLPSCVYFLMYPGGEEPLFNQVQFLLYDSTHALNFFMYFLTAKRFRLQLYKIFHCERLREIFSRSHQIAESPVAPSP